MLVIKLCRKSKPYFHQNKQKAQCMAHSLVRVRHMELREISSMYIIIGKIVDNKHKTAFTVNLKHKLT